jgi:DNA-binding response OmpR family regulator
MADNARPLILIVDDEPAVRELMKLHLAGEGYDVRLADDAIVAARALRESPPALMLVDIAMPYMDGLEFVASLSSELTDVPIVFMTGDAALLNAARSLGAPCLKKPFAIAELLERVREQLQRRPPRDASIVDLRPR